VTLDRHEREVTIEVVPDFVDHDESETFVSDLVILG
jgi:hypothetical protein